MYREGCGIISNALEIKCNGRLLKCHSLQGTRLTQHVQVNEWVWHFMCLQWWCSLHLPLNAAPFYRLT